MWLAGNSPIMTTASLDRLCRIASLFAATPVRTDDVAVNDVRKTQGDQEMLGGGRKAARRPCLRPGAPTTTI